MTRERPPSGGDGTRPGEPDDRTLPRRIAAGDRAALDLLYLRYKPRLVDYAAYLWKNRDAAEGVVHEAFAQVWEHRSKLRDSNVKAHLRKVVHDLVVDRLRSSDARGEREDQWDREARQQPRTPLQETARMELRHRLEAAIAALPEQQGKVVTLILGDGLTAAEAAKALDIKVATVKRHLALGKSNLRTNLEGVHDEWRSPSRGE